MPKEIMIETLFQEDKKKYLAIVFFTQQFAYKKEWLRLCYYRYALQKNHNICPSFQRSIAATFDCELKNEYKNPYSFIKKCFNSRSNLIDHINKLVEIKILEKKFINGENHYRLNEGYVEKLFYSYDCAWFSVLPNKVPHDLLHKMRNDLQLKYKDELQEHNAWLYTI